MLEALQQYRERTAFMWNSLPQHGGLQTSGGLAHKVGPDGGFKPFYGDTVIFSLSQPMIQWLEDIQAALYEACDACLAERIAPETFHITLHDLLNQPERMPEGCLNNRQRAMLAIEEVRGQHPQPIAIRSCCVFSMVGTSLVMGFEPATDADCAALMSMYELFQSIVPLSYPLTLHVTLAYYRPGVYDEGMLQHLREVVERLGAQRREWCLQMDQLHYATFDSMARYHLLEA